MADKAKPQGYPKRVFFILGNEFCERFSFYGMKAILVIYLTRQLNFDENTATSIYHAFNMVCYFTPIFGAMLADGWLGKYWVIFTISIFYALGNAVMALTAFTPNRAGAFAGMAMIAIGTGGIKPCVAAFGGDQFHSHQIKQQQSFFSIFYMSINMGSLISTILTPILRVVKCFGKDCYPLAFGVPAILMIVAVCFFLVGTPWYTRIPPQGNVLGKMCRTIGTAIRKKSKSKEKKEHWLQHASPEFSDDFIFDVRAVLRVLFMFLPLPVFWALFDQQGSRWTLQAGKMNGKLGNFRLLPDQIAAINPLLVIILVPIFESLIYPCLNKLRIPNRPLQRMGVGMFLAALAFVISGIVQTQIDRTQPKPVPKGSSQLRFFNSAPCMMNVSVAGQSKYAAVQPKTASDFFELKANLYNATIESKCGGRTPITKHLQVNLTSQSRWRVLLGLDFSSDEIDTHIYKHTLGARPFKGNAGVSILNGLNDTISVKLKGIDGQAEQNFKNISSMGEGAFLEIPAGDYHLSIGLASDPKEFERVFRLRTDQGGVYTVVLHHVGNKVEVTQHQDISPNVVHMLWQIPQYFIITTGEVFFSVTGLSFAYSQAPKSMKAVCQAAWNLTNAIGNLIVIIVAQAGKITDRAAELFFFAALMGATLIIFTIMALFYKYVNFDEIERERENKEMLADHPVDILGPPPEYSAKTVPGLPGYVPCVTSYGSKGSLPSSSGTSHEMNGSLPPKTGIDIYNNVNPSFIGDTTKL